MGCNGTGSLDQELALLASVITVMDTSPLGTTTNDSAS
jgi:hypothetical protein